MRSVVLLQKFALQGLVLAVADCRRFLIELALFVLADNSFFLDHSLEAFDSLLKILIVVYADCSHSLIHHPHLRQFHRRHHYIQYWFLCQLG